MSMSNVEHCSCMYICCPHGSLTFWVLENKLTYINIMFCGYFSMYCLYIEYLLSVYIMWPCLYMLFRLCVV